MKTISGLIAAVMALSVFATAGFAHVSPSTDIRVALDVSGTTMFAEYTANELGTVLQNIQNTGSHMFDMGELSLVKQTVAYGDEKMQISENVMGEGDTNLETVAQWKADSFKMGKWTFPVPTYANIYTAFQADDITDVTRVENTAWDYTTPNTFAQSILTKEDFTFVKSVGINMGTDCEPSIPTTPVVPSCDDFGCWWI